MGRRWFDVFQTPQADELVLRDSQYPREPASPFDAILAAGIAPAWVSTDGSAGGGHTTWELILDLRVWLNRAHQPRRLAKVVDRAYGETSCSDLWTSPFAVDHTDA